MRKAADPVASPAGLSPALTGVAWSRIWSPVVSEEMREDAWQALGLPDSFAAHASGFWSTFQLGAPAPRVPLLLHAAVGREAAAVREDWMRVAHHLGLSWDGVHLPPDQLGAACEVYACAIEREEAVLIEELRRRYLLPWCEFARVELARAPDGPGFLVERFEADLRSLTLPARDSLHP
jgi:hypothetical protein